MLFNLPNMLTLSRIIAIPLVVACFWLDRGWAQWLSMILFVICLVEFLLIKGFATSTFFLIVTMVMLDVLAGFIVTIISARKDLEFGAG